MKDAKLAIRCSLTRKTNIKIAERAKKNFADSSFKSMYPKIAMLTNIFAVIPSIKLLNQILII